MKKKIIFLLFLLSSCTNNRFYGSIYDYDTDKPIKNVTVNINNIKTQTDSLGSFVVEIKSNRDCIILLQKDGYADKKVYRKPDSLGKFSKKYFKNNKIYLFKKDSEFLNKNKL
ncbi:hypothetical protein [Flavobacterium sp.]|uniref:hypothetical protein n=1 Tax=Flavobacterium sp. TaxID=239 RepID=UPI0031DF0B01